MIIQYQKFFAMITYYAIIFKKRKCYACTINIRLYKYVKPRGGVSAREHTSALMLPYHSHIFIKCRTALIDPEQRVFKGIPPCECSWFWKD